MNDDEELQAAHAALFKRVSDRLAVQAGQLVSLAGEPRLRPVDVAGLFIATGVNVLAYHDGPQAPLDYLRRLLDELEHGAPPPRAN